MAPPWYGLDADGLRAIELHEARAHEHPGRRVADLGRRDPAARSRRPRTVPESSVGAAVCRTMAGAFDRRLGRSGPAVRDDRATTAPLARGGVHDAGRPARIGCAAEGFREVGATYLMVLRGEALPTRRAASGPVAEAGGRATGGGVDASASSGSGATRGSLRRRLLEQAADVLIEAFEASAADRSTLASELDPGRALGPLRPARRRRRGRRGASLHGRWVDLPVLDRDASGLVGARVRIGGYACARRGRSARIGTAGSTSPSMPRTIRRARSTGELGSLVVGDRATAYVLQ